MKFTSTAHPIFTPFGARLPLEAYGRQRLPCSPTESPSPTTNTYSAWWVHPHCWQ